jgi:homoserine dehydrogenase
VIADIIDVARTLTVDAKYRVPYLSFNKEALSDTPILPIDEIETAYYLRMTAQDKPGVMSEVSQCLSDAGISIEAIIQKEPAEGDNTVPMILITNRVVEKIMNKAITQIESLENISGNVTRIRVESLAG